MAEAALNLDAVRAFVYIVDLGSFTRAAEFLGTTQSAMSLKLKRRKLPLAATLSPELPDI